MPYIQQKAREKFDPAISTLLSQIKEIDPGELNYIFSKIVWRLFDREPSYSVANNMIGALECCKQEFIRRRLNNYEDQKIAAHGDL